MHRAIPAAIAIVLLASAELAEAANVNVETVLTDLEHPTAVAIRPAGTPESYEVFVAESGSGRVLKTSSSKPHDKTEVLTGLPTTTAGEQSDERGALPLLFLDERRFVVGIGGEPPDVRLYELQDGDTPIAADHATQKASPELQASADAPSGRCIGLARTRANDVVADMLLIAYSGDEQLNGVWKLPVRAGTLSSLSPLGDSSAVADKPTALAVSEQGYLLVAARSSNADKTSLIFANPTNGRTVLAIGTSLSEIIGLAYSPKSGQLYALAAKEDSSALFRIDNAMKGREPGVSETKLADIHRPTALAFGPDGALYVTSFGDQSEESKSGELLRLTGNF